MTSALPAVPRVSFTWKHTYDWCPRQWRYLYLDRVPPDRPPHSSLIVGSAFHAVVNEMYTRELFSRVFLQEIWPRHFEAAAAKERYRFRSQEEHEQLLRSGAAILEQFHGLAQREGMLVKPLKTEWKFTLPLDGYLLVGIIDLILSLRGGIKVLDFKTGWREVSQAELDEHDQLTFYALAAKALLGLEDVRVGFFYPRLGTIKYSRRTTTDYDTLQTDIRTILKRIGRQEFAPTYKNCQWCRYSDRCAAEDLAQHSGADLAWFYTRPR